METIFVITELDMASESDTSVNILGYCKTEAEAKKFVENLSHLVHSEWEWIGLKYVSWSSWTHYKVTPVMEAAMKYAEGL